MKYFASSGKGFFFFFSFFFLKLDIAEAPTDIFLNTCSSLAPVSLKAPLQTKQNVQKKLFSDSSVSQK